LIIRQNIVSSYVDSFLVEKDSASRVRFLKKQGYNYVPNFYPSSIGRCIREVVMNMLQYPSPPKSAKFLKICDNGNGMHERWQNWFIESGILVAKEYPLKRPKYRLSGKIDAIILLDNLVSEMIGELAVVEFKSANERNFKEMDTNNIPKAEYVEQIQLYLHFLSIPYGIIIVENKNTQDVLEFFIEYNEKQSMKLLSRIEYINKCVNEKKLPSRPFSSPKCYECRFCDYKEICWST